MAEPLDINELKKQYFTKRKSDIEGESRRSQMEMQDQLQRRFASLGQQGSGAAQAAMLKAQEQGEIQKRQAFEGVGQEEIQSQEAEALRQYAAGEAEKGRGFQSTQAGLQRAFEQAQREAGQTFAGGEAEKQRGFIGGQADKESALRRELMGLEQQFTSGEAEKGRGFAGGEAEKQRAFQQGQFEKEFGLKREAFASEKDFRNAQLQLQRSQFALDQFTQFYNLATNALQSPYDSSRIFEEMDNFSNDLDKRLAELGIEIPGYSTPVTPKSGSSPTSTTPIKPGGGRRNTAPPRPYRVGNDISTY